MSSSKRTNSLPLLPQWLVRGAVFLWGPGRVPTALVLLLLAFGAVWLLVWNHVRGPVESSQQYAVTLEKVRLTPPPGWIHSDIRADVFRNASLTLPLSILDDDLDQRIATAFSLNPWVAKVRVSKHVPARVEVELVYRRPVCMIEVPGELLPVDVEAVLLPSENFSPVEKQSYPCLAGVDTRPMGPPGQRWGDGRVVEGAEIAAALEPVWRQLRLYRIQPLLASAASPHGSYELFTEGGTRIYWGLAPSAVAPGELSAAEKVARLVQYANAQGGLDARQGPRQLDVRAFPPSSAKKSQ